MRILVIAPHPDDEVLGCGGTIAKYAKDGAEVYVCVVTVATPPLYEEAYAIEERKEMDNAHNTLGVRHTAQFAYPTAMLDTIDQYRLNNKLSDFIKQVAPDEVYIPHRGDIHKDHRIVADASMVAVRPIGETTVKRVLSYETMSETDWNAPNVQNAFIPNVFVDISDFLETKKRAMGHYQSQLKGGYAARSIQGIESLARHRGAVVGTYAAEAFMLLREVQL